MKRRLSSYKREIVLVYLILLMGGEITYGQAPISKDEAKRIVVEEVLTSEEINAVDISMYPSHLAPSTAILLFNDEKILSPPVTSWFILIDDDPTANLSHPFRFVFMD